MEKIQIEIRDPFYIGTRIAGGKGKLRLVFQHGGPDTEKESSSLGFRDMYDRKIDPAVIAGLILHPYGIGKYPVSFPVEYSPKVFLSEIFLPAMKILGENVSRMIF